MWTRDESVRPPGAQRDRSAEAKPADGRAVETVVMSLGKSVVIKGELSASEDLILYGQMEGSIRLPGHTLTIGPHADIKAQISAKAVVIMGAVAGNVTAGEKVEIQATGSCCSRRRLPPRQSRDGTRASGPARTPHRRRFGRRVAHTAPHLTSRAMRRSVSRRWRCGRVFGRDGKLMASEAR